MGRQLEVGLGLLGGWWLRGGRRLVVPPLSPGALLGAALGGRAADRIDPVVSLFLAGGIEKICAGREKGRGEKRRKRKESGILESGAIKEQKSYNSFVVKKIGSHVQG